jgi:hypothetical protein
MKAFLDMKGLWSIDFLSARIATVEKPRRNNPGTGELKIAGRKKTSCKDDTLTDISSLRVFSASGN